MKLHQELLQKKLTKKSKNPIRGELQDFSHSESQLHQIKQELIRLNEKIEVRKIEATSIAKTNKDLFVNNDALAKFFPLSFVGNIDNGSLAAELPGNSVHSLPNTWRNTKPIIFEAKDSLGPEADQYRALVNQKGPAVDSF